MRLHRDEAGQPPVPEHGRRHRHVVQVVAVALVRIVVDEDVAVAERVEASIANRRFDRKTEMPLKDRQPDPLRDHLHVGIEDGAAEVEALADDVVVRRLDHRDAHALGGGVERGTNHFDPDGIRLHG